MACRTLLRRKTQLALLSRACQHNAPAVVRLRRQRSIAGKAHLVALERHAVVLACSGGAASAFEVAGRPVEVRFRDDGAHYVFHSLSQGVAPPAADSQAPHAALKLSLPLRLEPERRRARTRVSLTGAAPIVTRFTHVVDARREFEARLTDVGDGGVGVRTHLRDIERVQTGDLFWVEVGPPGDRLRCEFVVRLAHLRPLRNSDYAAMGWTFQPTDDVEGWEKQLRKLKAFIARQRSRADRGGEA